MVKHLNKFFKPKNIEERKFQYEIELVEKKWLLQKIYFFFFDKMDEPERSIAKGNFDIIRIIRLPIPSSTHEAICYGFNWFEVPERYAYWDVICRKYEDK